MKIVEKRRLRLECCTRAGVIFSPTGEGRNYARLCFGYNSTSEIHEGIGKMADVFDAQGVL